MRKLVLALCSLATLFTLSVQPVLAQDPPAPAINPDVFFRVMTGNIDPGALKIYENQDYTGAVEDDMEEKSSDLPKTCQVKKDCKGTITFCSRSNPSNCKTEDVEGRCVSINPITKIGSCDYRNDVNYSANINGLEFTEKTDILFPKLQNKATYFENLDPNPQNSISYGTLQLLFPKEYQLQLKKDLYARAKKTASMGEFPLGGISNYKLICKGKEVNLLDLKSEADLAECGPMLSQETEYGFARTSICIPLLGCTPGDDASNKNYYIPFSRAALEGSYYYNQITMPKKVFDQKVAKVQESYPILPLLFTASEKALPSKLKQGPGQNEVGQMLDGMIPNQGFSVIDGTQLLKQKAGAVENQGLGQKLVSVFNNVLFGLGVRRHLYTFASPSQQILEAFQKENMAILLPQNKLSELKVDKQTNTLIGSEHAAGESTVPSQAKLTFSLIQSCGSPIVGMPSEYYSTFDTSVEDYAVAGLRNSCLPLESPGPDDGSINCNQGLPEISVAGLVKSEGQRLADNWFAVEPKGKNYWAECNNDVIKRSQSAGLDPIFVLSIWLHESAASNYTAAQVADLDVEDFGIHTDPSAPPENFSAQLDSFLRLPNAYATCGKNIREFISRYWFGHCTSEGNAAEASEIDRYVNELGWIYSIIAPGKSLPSWP